MPTLLKPHSHPAAAATPPSGSSQIKQENSGAVVDSKLIVEPQTNEVDESAQSLAPLASQTNSRTETLLLHADTNSQVNIIDSITRRNRNLPQVQPRSGEVKTLPLQWPIEPVNFRELPVIEPGDKVQLPSNMQPDELESAKANIVFCEDRADDYYTVDHGDQQPVHKPLVWSRSTRLPVHPRQPVIVEESVAIPVGDPDSTGEQARSFVTQESGFYFRQVSDVKRVVPPSYECDPQLTIQARTGQPDSELGPIVSIRRPEPPQHPAREFQLTERVSPSDAEQPIER